MNHLLYFASEDVHHEPAKADLFGALGIDGTLLLLQTGAFLVLLFIVGKFAYPTLLKAIENRRDTIEAGLKNAKKAEAELARVEDRVADIIRTARREAGEIVTHSKQEAADLVATAEARADKRAKTIVAEAEAELQTKIVAARMALKKETAQLVALATERIIKQKVDGQKDAALIAAALQEAE